MHDSAGPRGVMHSEVSWPGDLSAMSRHCAHRVFGLPLGGFS